MAVRGLVTPDGVFGSFEVAPWSRLAITPDVGRGRVEGREWKWPGVAFICPGLVYWLRAALADDSRRQSSFPLGFRAYLPS